MYPRGRPHTPQRLYLRVAYFGVAFALLIIATVAMKSSLIF
ncbi:hypothetical protein TPCCA_0201a [Treponema paraluiscuniculi Cuniculi A]|uniref:Uncharacterized protein n=2 Tax=Treponema paraluiscuniculi TaxID=53435 RepID=F7XRC1_TREPU|nr:hypothetical protein TPCCA_0201a [Treponema paraluiscuniculi Cuniculi A]WKC72087.1 hypothetical protein TPLL2_0201a [Treponema paraluiscuniculi]